jgi:NADH-quinone oxidoreductase subunit J
VTPLAAAADPVVISTGEAIVFWVLGPIALAGALGMVLSRNAVHSALWLINTMLALGVFYVVQEAPFLGAVQIIVYTGAIMILFLFVLMLVGRDTSDSVVETLRGQRVAAIVLGIGFAGLVGAGIAEATRDTPVTGLEAVQGGAAGGADGNVPAIAALLFTRYLLAFEVTSALLITAAVGAMVLAHTEREPGSRQSQKELSRARFLSGEHPQTLPGPGVYARANSIAAPGRLPDGAPSRASFATGVEPQVVDELPPAGSVGIERAGLPHSGGTDAALGTLGGGTTGPVAGSGEEAPR